MAMRRHIITGEPILFAPGRAGRPNAFGREHGQDPCPFCAGNEAATPPEILHIGEPWRVRVFPNKYPAVEGHEIIVESRDHDATFASLADPSAVVSVFVDRYRAHAGAGYVSVFKNVGERAGASIDHLHAQVMPLPFVPVRPSRESAAFVSAKKCPLCAAIETHRRDGLLVFENRGWVVLAPHGSQFAFEQWLIPQRHQNEITTLSAAEIDDLAAGLQLATRGAESVARSHNVLFMNFPREPSAHLYVAVVPRMTSLAGFELATGTFIDIVDPAAAARRMR